jgi:hypothetical protein
VEPYTTCERLQLRKGTNRRFLSTAAPFSSSGVPLTRRSASTPTLGARPPRSTNGAAELTSRTVDSVYNTNGNTLKARFEQDTARAAAAAAEHTTTTTATVAAGSRAGRAGAGTSPSSSSSSSAAPLVTYSSEAELAVAAHFYRDPASANGGARAGPSATLFGASLRENYPWSALLGQTSSTATTAGTPAAGGELIFFNTQEPSCVLALGVQGSGKSHTTAVLAEACLLPFACPSAMPLVSLPQPMAALAFHFGKDDDDISELVGLVKLSPAMEQAFATGAAATESNGDAPPASAESNGDALPGIAGAEANGDAPPGVGVAPSPPPRVKRVVVLVSPTYYKQRTAFYADQEGVEVFPLLFNWHTLNASHLKSLMRLDEQAGGGQQLYVSVLLDLLRVYQQDAKHPVFDDFLNEIKARCNVACQSGPLEQRMQLLASLVFESKRNQANAELTQTYANL